MVVRLTDSVVRASALIDAPRARVWRALVDPAQMTRWMPATRVDADWREGGAVVWHAEFSDRPREVHGTVVRVEDEHALEYRYVDPITRGERHVVIELLDADGGTRVHVVEDGHRTERERAHGEGGWRLALANLSALLAPR